MPTSKASSLLMPVQCLPNILLVNEHYSPSMIRSQPVLDGCASLSCPRLPQLARRTADLPRRRNRIMSWACRNTSRGCSHIVLRIYFALDIYPPLYPVTGSFCLSLVTSLDHDRGRQDIWSGLHWGMHLAYVSLYLYPAVRTPR